MLIQRSAILLLLSLSACQSGPATPGAQSPVAPAPATNALAQGVPVGQSAVAPCARGPQVSFGVFANTRERAFTTDGLNFDRSRPLVNALVSINGLEARTDALGQVNLPLPASADVTLRIAAAGYDSYEEQISAFGPSFNAAATSDCVGFFAALSPLSDEELNAAEITAETGSFPSLAPGMHFNESTGFSYAVVSTPAELARLESSLKPFLEAMPSDPNFFSEFIAKGLAEGKQAVLISNGSTGKGDVQDLISRVSRQGDKAVLASHLNLLMDEEIDAIAAVERGYVKTEVVLLPADIKRVVFDALLPAPHGVKKRLEVAVENARLK